MSDLIEELERIEREATPGEWEAYEHDTRAGLVWWITRPTGEINATVAEVRMVADEPLGSDKRNAQAIASLRNALPRIIAELRAARDVEGSLVTYWSDDHCCYESDTASDINDCGDEQCRAHAARRALDDLAMRRKYG